MTPNPHPQNSARTLGLKPLRTEFWVALCSSLLICLGLISFNLAISTAVFLGLFSLAILNLAALVYGQLALKPKNTNTYTEPHSTIAPPANPVDVLSGVPDLLWTIDYASRRVSSHNAMRIEHHPEAGQFAKLANIFPARVSRQYLETLIELQNTQKPMRFEYTLGSGEQEATFEARFTPLSQRDCIVVIRDISHIKATEAALFKQQIFTQQIIDSSPNLVFIRDQHARFLLVNQATQALLGHDLLVQSHFALEHAVLSAGDAEVFATGKPLRIEDSCTLANGRTHWFDISKVAVEREGKTYILNIAIDITNQKEHEATEGECKTLLHAMAHALPHAFLLIQEEHIVFANQAACERLGYAPEILIGQALANIINQEIDQGLSVNSAQGEAIACSSRKLDPKSALGELISLQ